MNGDTICKPSLIFSDAALPVLHLNVGYENSVFLLISSSRPTLTTPLCIRVVLALIHLHSMECGKSLTSNVLPHPYHYRNKRIFMYTVSYLFIY